MDDTQFVCSKEYEELTKNVQNNFALRMVFQLVGIPTSDTFKEQRCGKGPRKPLVDNIVQESLDHPERKPEGPEEEQEQEQEPEIPTTEASEEQVKAAIQKVNGSSEPESPSEPESSSEPQASLPPQDPTEKSQVPSVIQKQSSIEAPSEPQASLPSSLPPSLPSSLPPQEPSVKKVPSTITRRGGRSLRRAL
jgi:hypothetical protein